MSRGDYNSLFMPNSSTNDPQRIRQIFSAHDFPPIAASKDTKIVPPPAAKPQPVVHQYNANQNVNLPPVAGQQGVPPGPYGMSNHVTLTGTGVLTWLSPKAGILSIQDGKTVSFQTNEFCDRGLHDLTTSLRVGFTLKFSAVHTQGDEYTAVCVGPVFGDEAKEVFKDSEEINLHPTDESKPRGMHEYSTELELAAYQTLLAPFEKQGMAKLQLSSLHSQIANTDEPLFRYVGSSAMKRRVFVERRTHIFCLNADDSILLQNPAVYRVVHLLSTYLLRHGGVTAIEDLYNYFSTQDDDPSLRDTMPRDRSAFMNLLSTQSFMFSVFPNRAYVAVKRALPSFDYPGFIAQYFPELARRAPYGHQGVQKLMSINTVQPFHHHQNYHQRHGHAHQAHHQHYNNGYHNSPEYYGDGAAYGYQEEYHDGYHNGPHNGYHYSSRRSNHSSSQLESPDTTDIWAPRQQQEFGSLLSLSSAGALAVKTAAAAAEESKKIGQPNCTCKCSCGAADAQVKGNGRWLPPNFIDVLKPSSTWQPSNSASNAAGTIGQRPSGSSSDSDKAQPSSEPFNIFGVNDVLSGHFDALRFGNL